MTNDEIRELRRGFSNHSKEWAACTKALHAVDPGDRTMWEYALKRILSKSNHDFLTIMS